MKVNSMIWERVPKITYCGRDKLEFAVYDAVVNFNDGRQGSVDIFRVINIKPGHYTTVMCYNKRRLYSANYKAKDTSKKSRKVNPSTEKSEDPYAETKRGQNIQKWRF